MTSRRQWLFAGLAIGAAGMLIRIWLIQQPVNSDDVHYFGEAATAGSLSELGDSGSSNGMRLAVMALPAIYSGVFDAPFAAFYGTVYTYALLSFVGLFAFAWVMSGPRAAAIAAALWATSYTLIAVDTRLIPDNLGTALALIGLALIGHVGLREEDAPDPSPRTIALLAGLGGLSLWLAFCARESFFVFGGVGVGFALLSRRRWLVTAAVCAGLFVGFLLEYAAMSVAFDDGLLRWKAAFAYRESVAELGQAEESAFAGYTASDLLVRYPKLIAAASRADLAIFVLGLVGFVAWARRWRDPRRLARLGAAVAAFGFVAFAIVDVSPVVPLLREKLRYYATAAPLFCVAAAELIVVALFARVEHPRLARWLNRPHRTVAVAGLAAVLVLAGLRTSARGREFLRNGNDAHWDAATRMRADADEKGRATSVFTDLRTSRVAHILLPRTWATRRLTEMGERTPGYLLYEWRRLNANLRGGKAGPRHYQHLEDSALVLRHRRGNELVDVFYQAEQPIVRRRIDLDPYPSTWGGMCGSSKQLFALSEASPCPTERDLLRYTGFDAPWRRREGAALDGDMFVEVVFVATSERPATLRATLNRWEPGARKQTTLPMGTLQIMPGEQTYAAWTYVPRAVDSFRVILRAPAAVELSEVRTYALSRDPADDVRGIGKPW